MKFGTLPASLLVSGLLLAADLSAANIPVTNTNDSGAGSLRDAISQANGDVLPDVITFNIPGGGPHTIAPATQLPKITNPLTIDGYTQPGASPNTNPPDQGLNSVLRIQIDCTNGGTYCLVIGANDVTIRGLVMNNGIGGIASDFFVEVQRPVIEGNYFGVTPDGMTAVSLPASITLGQHKDGRIGGTTPAARNLFGGTGTGNHIDVSFAADNDSVIQGNLFCTDKTGATPIGNFISRNGITLSGGAGGGNTSNMTVGGLTPAAGNVFACPDINLRINSMAGLLVQGNKFGVDTSGTKGIASARGTGIYLEGNNGTVVIGGTAAGASNVFGSMLIGIASFGGSDAVIQGNFIGTDSSATLDLGNAIEGISLSPGVNLTIGGTGAGEANTILYNRAGGIRVTCCSGGNTIRGNRISENLGNRSGAPSIGINLFGVDGPDANDPDDPDTGGNDLQNFPLITSSGPEGGGTRVIGTLDSTASSSFTLDFYAGTACRSRPRAQAQADQYLGSANVSTDGSGDAAFNVLLPTPTLPGQPITATATNGAGSTSELTPEIVFSSEPISGNPAGGTQLTIKGMLFTAGATVSIGGTPATGIIVDSATQIRATTPAKLAGSFHDVVVTLPGGLSGRLRNGYVAWFLDATGNSGFSPFISRLSANGVTAGCGGGNYCTNSPVTRAQMAVFLLVAKKGLCYAPPPPTGTVFGDVPSGGFAAAFIEALAALGVTGGCGGGNYCPNNVVTREQMAVFLLRTQEGPNYFPPACSTATFNDVPCSSPFASWIYELVRREITAGCGGGSYCATDAVTRGQMAVFISTMFGLP
jgi:parallel beta-helix repeat protein